MKGQLRGAAQQGADRRGILHARQLHQDATGAERLHGRLRDADGVDAPTNDLDTLLKRRLPTRGCAEGIQAVFFDVLLHGALVDLEHQMRATAQVETQGDLFVRQPVGPAPPVVEK